VSPLRDASRLPIRSTSCATPPTIADLRAERVAGAWVWCIGLGCAHHGRIAFDAIRATSETPFIAGAVTSIRLARGSRDVHLMPDCPPYRAQGCMP